LYVKEFSAAANFTHEHSESKEKEGTSEGGEYVTQSAEKEKKLQMHRKDPLRSSWDFRKKKKRGGGGPGGQKHGSPSKVKRPGRARGRFAQC